MTNEQSRPKLVQFASLTAAHFVEYPVWMACASFDYDEAWYDDTDEETFRPWREALPVDPESGMFLVRARFTTHDGMELAGFGIMVDRAPVELAALTTQLQKDASAIFPIRFAAEPGVAMGLQSGEVAGFAGVE